RPARSLRPHRRYAVLPEPPPAHVLGRAMSEDDFFAGSADDALARLMSGNERFVSGRARAGPSGPATELVAHQNPFATVLGCSDSRVPPELLFDVGFGDLFVIRVA